jgi:parvulin-like peptidyl-prolyl isomerase
VSKSTADSPKRIGARHILIQYMGAERAEASVVRSREQALAVAQVVLKRIRAGEDFARLTIEYSDEPGAGPRGGSLGRFPRGVMVGAFDAVAFKLAVGEISDVVETPFGFHIIQRTE